MTKFAVKSQKGDTIIEVVLAMTLLTLFMFTAWGLVNRSTQASLAARKRIDMVNQLKEQAEILKTKYAEADGELDQLSSNIKNEGLTGGLRTSLTDYNEDFCNDSTVAGSRSEVFHFDQYAKPATNPKEIEAGSTYVWIEYTKPSLDYADFYVRGCWATSGGSQKTDNSQFIVRLNK